MGTLIIVPLSGDPGVSDNIAKIAGVEIVRPFIKEFPDGEIYIRISNDIAGEDILIVQSMYPNQNMRYVETLLAIDALNRLEVDRISILFTYLAYMRQDKVFLKGEPVSLDVVLKTFKSMGKVYEIYVIEPHVVWRNRFQPIDGVSILAERFMDLDNLLIVAPDRGGVERASRFYRKVKDRAIDLVYMIKERDRQSGKVVSRINTGYIDKIRGSNAVIVDDIVSTGGTLIEAARRLYDAGASSVSVACAHPLFVGDAISKIRNVGIDRVVCSKTVSKLVDGVDYVDLSNHIYRSIFR